MGMHLLMHHSFVGSPDMQQVNVLVVIGIFDRELYRHRDCTRAVDSGLLEIDGI